MASFRPETQRDQLMVLVAVLALGAAGAYWYSFYDPKATEREARAAHVEAMETSNQRAKAELARGNPEDLKRQAREYRENLELMRRLVPTENELPMLLEQVSTAARRVGLDIATVEPVPVIQGEEFDTYRYRLSIVGGYHKTGRFLANVGSLTRIVAPVNVQMEAAREPAPTAAAPGDRTRGREAGPGEGRILTKFEIQTYVARSAMVGDGYAPVELTASTSGSTR